jgi:chromosome segregation ATPase
MNKQRRKEAYAIRARIEDAQTEMASIMEDLGNLRDEEQEGFDNMSEGLQQGETGQRIEAAANELDEAHNTLDEIDQILQTAMEHIDEACGA